MNDRIDESHNDTSEELLSETDAYVRRNPLAAILVALGAGVLIALVVRAIRPEPTASERLSRAMEDLESRLRDAAAPALRRAGALASDGLEEGHARLGSLFRDGRKRVRGLFS